MKTMMVLLAALSAFSMKAQAEVVRMDTRGYNDANRVAVEIDTKSSKVVFIRNGEASNYKVADCESIKIGNVDILALTLKKTRGQNQFILEVYRDNSGKIDLFGASEEFIQEMENAPAVLRGNRGTFETLQKNCN